MGMGGANLGKVSWGEDFKKEGVIISIIVLDD